MEYMHNGIRIWVEGDGKFTAFDQSGATVRTNSLKAMKIHLDKKGKDLFKTFTVLGQFEYSHIPAEQIKGTRLFRYTVVGIDLERGRPKNRARRLFRVSSGNGKSETISCWQTLFADDPKAIEAHKAASKYRDETDAIMEKRYERQEELDREVDKFTITPEEALAKMKRE